MANGKAFIGYSLAVLIPAASVAYATHGERWHFTESEVGAINGIEIGPEISVAEPETTEVVDVNTRLELSRELIKIARTDDWCSSEKILYDHVNYPYVHIPERATAIPDDETYSADLCIDSQSVAVDTNFAINLYMGTHNPVIPQLDGNPSIFLTYNDPQALGRCLDAKEEIREKVQEDIDRLIGERAALYQVKIHVDKRNLDHPCDDSFGS